MRKSKAFTLIELLVVIAIIGLISSVALVAMNKSRDKAKIARARHDLRQILNAISMLSFDTGK